MSLPTHQEAIFFLNQEYLTRFSYLAGCVVYGYDYLLTFSQEVEYIWKRHLTLPTFAFLLLRYITPIELLFSLGLLYPNFTNRLSCHIIQAAGALNITAVILIGLIMTIRTVALYNHDKVVLCSLSVLMIGQTVMLIMIGNDVKVAQFSLGDYAGCSITSPTELNITALWWCPLVTDTIVFLFTVIRLRALRKHANQNYSLYYVLMRDGVFYYIIICLVYTSNTLNWAFNHGPSAIAGLNLGVAIPSTLICRLTLNLQGFHSHSGEDITISDDVSGVFTTAPSVLDRFSSGQAGRLTGEGWNKIYLEGFDAKESETTVLQSSVV